jgi:hypothetical protein
LEADVVSADHAMLKEIKIADIKVGHRHRRDMGDLTTLADSTRQEGRLQPIGEGVRHRVAGPGERPQPLLPGHAA